MKINTKTKLAILATLSLSSSFIFAEEINDKELFSYEYANCGNGHDGQYQKGYKNGYRIINPKYHFDNISYYVDPGMGSEWKRYAKEAAELINSVGSSLNISILSSKKDADSYIFEDYTLGSCIAAGASLPKYGKIGAKIKINPDLGNRPENEIIATLAHEMLHTVGFKHAAGNPEKGVITIPGTTHIGMWKQANYKPLMMPNAGKYKLTFLDKYAIKKMFPK